MSEEQCNERNIFDAWAKITAIIDEDKPQRWGDSINVHYALGRIAEIVREYNGTAYVIPDGEDSWADSTN